MKKFLSLVLAAIMLLSLAACSNSDGNSGSNSGGNSSSNSVGNSGGNSSDNSSPYKIAIATNQSGEVWEIGRTYLETVVGPTLNMEFMYSEVLSDANDLIAFMEQAYAAGCVGIVNFVTSSDAISQGTHKAEEWGMYFISECSTLVEDVAELPHNLGNIAASAGSVGEAYKMAFENIFSDGEKHSVYLFSGAAVGGDSGQGAATHFYAASGVLEAFQEAYDLTYPKSITDIVNTQQPGAVETGDPDVNIYIYPGFNPSEAASTALPLLQTGTYDSFAAVFSFAAFTSVIDDVENALGKDIKLVGTGNIEQQTKTGFGTLDSTGDTVLNAIILNDLVSTLGTKCVVLYNALNGKADAMKDNGRAVLFGGNTWVCNDAETFARLEKLNTAPEYYTLTADELKALTVDENPDVTWQDIAAVFAELDDLDALLAKKGL